MYSFAAKIGKPKGSRNKKTLEKLQQRNESIEEIRFHHPIISTPVTDRSVSLDCDFDDEVSEDQDNILNLDTWMSDHTLVSLSDVEFPVDIEGLKETTMWDAHGSSDTTTDKLDQHFFASPPSLSGVVQSIDLFPGNMQPLEDTGLQSQFQMTENSQTAQLDSTSQGNIQTSCSCLQHQFESLCKLKALEQNCGPVQADTDFATTLNALTATQTVLNCDRCQEDSETNMLVTMVVDLAFRRLQNLTAATPDGLVELRLTLGGIQMVETEPLSSMRKTIVTLARDQVERVFIAMRTRVSQLNARAKETTQKDVDKMHAMRLQLTLMRLEMMFTALQAILK